MTKVSVKITLTGTIDEEHVEGFNAIGGDLIDHLNNVLPDGVVLIERASLDFGQVDLVSKPVAGGGEALRYPDE